MATNYCEKLRETLNRAKEEYPKKKKWLIDNRKNEGLHALYVKFAISGILAIDAAIKRVSDESKISHCNILLAMWEERAKLILEDTAYWAAFRQLNELVEKGLLTKTGDLFIATSKQEE